MRPAARALTFSDPFLGLIITSRAGHITKESAKQRTTTMYFYSNVRDKKTRSRIVNLANVHVKLNFA